MMHVDFLGVELTLECCSKAHCSQLMEVTDDNGRFVTNRMNVELHEYWSCIRCINIVVKT